MMNYGNAEPTDDDPLLIEVPVPEDYGKGQMDTSDCISIHEDNMRAREKNITMQNTSPNNKYAGIRCNIKGANHGSVSSLSPTHHSALHALSHDDVDKLKLFYGEETFGEKDVNINTRRASVFLFMI